MKVDLEPGKYVVAVSGGVDSIALLHILQGSAGYQLTVAHFDHGMRRGSRQDRLFVKGLAAHYGLPFVYGEGNLGESASEASARTARYDFLHKARIAAGAHAIITAHHQDDALETAILNIVRGTGRKGVSSLQSSDVIKRPLLHVPKSELVTYAEKNNLKWREDSTNLADIYKRNYVRHKLLTRFSDEERTRLHEIILQLRSTNDVLDKELSKYMGEKSGRQLDRARFILLPHDVSREVMAAWLRQNDVREFDRKSLERVVHAGKTYEIGKRINISKGTDIVVEKNNLALKRIER